jgi:hypothetical protein
MTELLLNSSISINKNEFNIYEIILHNLSNGDQNLLDNLNNQLQLSTSILTDCHIKTKCFNDLEYNNTIETLKTELSDKYNTSIEQLKLNYENQINSYKNDIYNKDLQFNSLKQSYDSDLSHKFNSSIEQLKLNYENQINSYKNDIYNKDLQFHSLKQSYDSIYADIKHNIESNINEQFKYKENLFKQQILDEQNKYLELNKKLDSLINIKADSIKNEYDIIINNLHNDINLLKYKNEQLNNSSSIANMLDNKIFDLHNSINSNFSNINKFLYNSDSSQSGEIGELFIYNYISDFLQLNNGSIQRVNGKQHAGDMFLLYNHLKCCIESKFHSNAIRQDQINRFLNVDILNSEYNSGIFISSKSDFVNSSSIKHFDIIISHNKPVIFLANIIKKPHEILLAIKIINFLLYQQSFNNSNLQSFISFLNSHLSMLNQLFSSNNSLANSLADSNRRISLAVNDIELLLNIKHQAKFICNVCHLGFDKKTPFNKHVKSCKSND